jgi:hypothetical protein
MSVGRGCHSTTIVGIVRDTSVTEVDTEQPSRVITEVVVLLHFHLIVGAEGILIRHRHGGRPPLWMAMGRVAELDL